jgi:uncharacterized membrane-anchored protein
LYIAEYFAMCTEELLKCLGKTDDEIKIILSVLPPQVLEWIEQDCVPLNASMKVTVPQGLIPIFDVLDNYVPCHTFSNITSLFLCSIFRA